MIKRFENFEAKMDYNDLVNILTDFEEFNMVVDKLMWKKTSGNMLSPNMVLNIQNFDQLTSENGYILIYLQKGSSNALTDLLSTFCNRIGELNWVTLQYNFYTTPFKICICKKDDVITKRFLAKINVVKN